MTETVYVASTATKQIHLVLKLKKAGYVAVADTREYGRCVIVDHLADEAGRISEIVARIDRGARLNQN